MTQNSTQDDRDPARYLKGKEQLLWSGRPSVKGPPGRAEAYVRFFGYLCVLILIGYLAFFWIKRDEMEGAWGIALLLMFFPAGGCVLLLGIVPKIVRAGYEGTRYAVTDKQAFILRGLGKLELTRYSIPPEEEIVVKEESKGLFRVRFLFFQAEFRKYNRVFGFERLSEEEAHAAAEALKTIRGKAGAKGKVDIKQLA